MTTYKDKIIHVIVGAKCYVKTGDPWFLRKGRVAHQVPITVG